MGSSHGSGTVEADVAKVGPRWANISGLAKGESSDAVNDRLGRPREGQKSPPGPRPHFVRLNLAGVELGAVLGTPVSTSHPDHVADVEFEPILADQSQVVFGWLPDLKGDWLAADAVRRLVVSGGRVEAQFADGSASTLANYGVDAQSARLFRARVAEYVSQVKKQAYRR